MCFVDKIKIAGVNLKNRIVLLKDPAGSNKGPRTNNDQLTKQGARKELQVWNQIAGGKLIVI